ncbi:TPA: hypothetical protein ACQ0F8_001974 [Streptococcus agalactiae]|nr:hypothetical protein [Streptococcus agalactiae]
MTKVDTDKILKLLRKNATGGDTLAKRIGISKQTIIQLRNGRKKVESLTIRNADKIQTYLENIEK